MLAIRWAKPSTTARATSQVVEVSDLTNRKPIEAAGYQFPTTGGIGVVDVDMPWDAGAAAKGALQGQFAYDCGTSAQPWAVI